MTCNFINTPYRTYRTHQTHQSSSIKSGYLGGDEFLSHHSGSGFHVAGLSDGFHFQSIFFQMMYGILCRPWFSIKEQEGKSYQQLHHLQCITSNIILTGEEQKTTPRFCKIHRRGLFVFLVVWLVGWGFFVLVFGFSRTEWRCCNVVSYTNIN